MNQWGARLAMFWMPVVGAITGVLGARLVIWLSGLEDLRPRAIIVGAVTGVGTGIMAGLMTMIDRATD